MRHKLLSVVACVIFAPYLALAQGGATISGKITDDAGEPLPGANVLIQRTNLGAASDINGEYKFVVPPNAVRGQQVTIEARFIGYRSSTKEIQLAPGNMTQDFVLAIDVLHMDDIIVTGVVEETPKSKLALSVGRIATETLEQVPATSPETALYGKVAGVKVVKNGGQPGSSAEVLLRAPTSIDGRFRSQSPLYIIDGTIIDPSISGSPMSDIPGEDLESIEVIKGAAAASLYGARAANGVISVTTKRGQNLALNQTRIRIRNEFGFNDLENAIELSRHHPFRVNAEGDFVDTDGNIIDPRGVIGARAEDHYADPTVAGQEHVAGFSFYDNDYKYVATGKVGDPLILLDSPTGFDQLDRFFDPGAFFTNTASVSRNMEDTNFLVSFNRYQERGVVPGLDGIERYSMRVNVDHKFKRTLTLGVSGLFSNSNLDQVSENSTSGTTPFYALTFMAPDADLGLKDANGEFFVRADPNSVEENPLYLLETQSRQTTRRRLMGAFNLRWEPVNYFKLEGNFSYDRSDRRNDFFWPIGFQGIDVPEEVVGRLDIGDLFDEALNGGITASYSKQFGELVLRAKARGLFERAEFRRDRADGRDLGVQGTRTLSSADPGSSRLFSDLQQVRSNGYSFITGIDYKDRYIADFLVRRDGSSLFGPDERWHTYFRVSGAYRLSQESWWFLPFFEEFKLRGSYGTAGGRPAFVARFETFSVTGGNVNKENLGNKALKPEDAQEIELGLDTAFLNRFTMDLTYAKSEIEDQLLFVPLPAFTGFSRQWQNAGKLETEVFEGAIQASIIQKRDVSWSAGFTFDIPIKQKIVRLDIPQYSDDPFLVREGEELGAIWGDKFITSLADLPAGVDQSQFQVNDDGLVVFVGTGNSFRNGMSGLHWGRTSADPLFAGADLTDDLGVSHTYTWGMPVKLQVGKFNSAGEFTGYTTFTRLGGTKPDFNFGFNSSFRYKGFTLYGLLDAQIGGDIYSQTLQWGLRENKLGIVDQAGKPDELKKPGKYYEVLYSTNATNSFFVEDGTYMKIRELRLAYSFDRNRLSGIFGGLLNKVTVGVVGRNLITFTGFRGYDPEVGQPSNDPALQQGASFGNGSVGRFDAFNYPNFRTFTGILEFEF